jgi:uncharacterized damage-inducible protein DinB
MESQEMKKTYRNGPLGALMDEYERAASELRRLVARIPEDDFVRIVDAQTSDEACRSAQTIMSHVVNAAYGYADYLREQFSMDSTRPVSRVLTKQESLSQLDAAFEYTLETLKDHWGMTDEQMMGFVIKTRWGAVYDVEGLLEHAIVHILRHRRQLERFISRDLITVQQPA